MEIELKMTLKEADRLAVMKQLDNKKMNLRKASKELGISYRQQIRLRQNYQRERPKGLISKRRGNPGNHRLSNELILHFLNRSSLILENISSPLIISAYSFDREVMAISHDTYPIFSVQLHPESIGSKNGQKILGNFLKTATFTNR